MCTQYFSRSRNNSNNGGSAVICRGNNYQIHNGYVSSRNHNYQSNIPVPKPEPKITIVLKPEEEKDEDCPETLQCLICMSRRKITVCLPCMHMTYCVTCSIECQSKSKVLSCPTCRAEIKEVKRIYM